MTQPQFDDPFDEVKQKALQGGSAVGYLLEALARLHAANAQRKAADAEAAGRRDEAAAAARDGAEELAARWHADRARLAELMDTSPLAMASPREAAATWRQAVMHPNADDPVVRKVADAAFARLSELSPNWRAAYDRHRQAGMSINEAAMAAARDSAEADAAARSGPQARPHGNSPHGDPLRAGANGRSLPAGGQMVEELDAAARRGARQRLGDASEEHIAVVQTALRDRGSAEASDPVALARAVAQYEQNQGLAAQANHLMQHADTERPAGRTAGGTPDDPRTPPDEHTEGQVLAVLLDDGADQKVAVATALQTEARAADRPGWAQAFLPLEVKATKQPSKPRRQANGGTTLRRTR